MAATPSFTAPELDRHSGAPTGRSSSAAFWQWQTAALAAGTVLYLYCHLFQFPWVPIWRFGDQSFYLTHAERMLNGEVLYRDLFQFNLPGTEGLYYLLIRCFGPTPWIASLALLVAGSALVLVVLWLARKAVSGSAALLPPLAYLLCSERSNFDGSHHWYSTLLVLLAAMVLAERSSWTRVAAAGSLLGVAALFTSNRGVFAVGAVALFLLLDIKERRERLIALSALLLPFIALVGGTILYLAHRVGFKILFDSLIVFPLCYYPGEGSENTIAAFWGPFRQLVPWRWQTGPMLCEWLVLCIGVPVTYIIFFSRHARRHVAAMRESSQSRVLVLVGIVGVSAMLSVANAPSAIRLNCSAAFGYVLAAQMLGDGRSRRLPSALIAAALVIGAAELLVAEMRWKGRVDTPRGPVAVLQPEVQQYYQWVARHVRPGDGLFGSVELNYILGLPNPTPLPYVSADSYTRPEQVLSVVAGIERQHTRFVVWSAQDDLNSEQRLSPDDNLPPLRRSLRQHYRRAIVFADQVEILERTSQ